MKTSPEGRPIKINDLEDLGNIQRKHEIPRDNKLYGKWGRKPNRRMRMEHSQNLYGLFVVYRYVCVDDIIINSPLLFLSKLAFDFIWFCTDFHTCSSTTLFY